MEENVSGRLSFDFQQSISEVRKLSLSLHYPAEYFNCKGKKMLFQWRFDKSFFLLALLPVILSQSKKKKKVGKEEQKPKTYRSKFLPDNCNESYSAFTWYFPSVRGNKLTESIPAQVGGKPISVLPVTSHQVQSMSIYKVCCWLANLWAVS